MPSSTELHHDTPAGSAQTAPGENHAYDNRTAWLHRDKFGMFIHWGLYSGLARGEWVMHEEKIPVAEYTQLAQTFNPEKFDAGQWVTVAKNAGMKYLTITAKHHDGFCMFDTKVDKYNIVQATPFKRDILMEIKNACDEANIKFGIYYSHAQDWVHPGAACHGPKWDAKQDGCFRTYWDTVSIPQIKELLARYEPTHLWLDTPHDMTPALGRELMEVVRSCKADVLVNSRLVYNGSEVDSLSAEQLDELQDLGVDFLSYRDRFIPEDSPWECWETCMTLNDSWGFQANDNHWKTPEKVIAQLVEVVSKGGTFLLNVGPTGEGEIPVESVDILAQVGAWLEVNGEAIYGASPTPLTQSGKLAEPPVEPSKQAAIDRPWLTTAKGRAVYIHVFDWPSGQLVIDGIPGVVTSACRLSDPNQAPLRFIQEAGTLTIQLPAERPAELVPVLALQVEPSDTVHRPQNPEEAE